MVLLLQSKVFVMRERMKSLKESIYAGIKGRVAELGFAGFLPVPSQWEIRHKTGGKFSFGGMQNIIDMKGSFNYKYFLMEEAARTSQQTIDTLGPTLRNVDGAELWWIWNPESSNDPMSQEFIVPFQDSIDRDGYYEDDYHLVIKVGYEDNPWFEWEFQNWYSSVTEDTFALICKSGYRSLKAAESLRDIYGDIYNVADGFIAWEGRFPYIVSCEGAYSPIPIPPTSILFGTGMIGLLGLRKIR